MNARNFFTWALLVLLPSTPSFGHEKVITAKELPAAAQTFINTHFKGKKITEAKKDVEMRKTCYDVTLDNGAKLEFDGKGVWKEIKCKSSAVPPATVPAAISKYVKANYPKGRIVKIERDQSGHEVELSDGTEIKFNKQWKVIRVGK